MGSRADAISAYREALIDAWESLNAADFAQYKDTLSKQYSEEESLAKLASDARLQSLANAKGNITQANVNARLKETPDLDERALLESYKAVTVGVRELKKSAINLLAAATTNVAKLLKEEPNNESLEEIRIIDDYLNHINRINELKATIKKAESTLDVIAYEQYPKLNEAEISVLVVDDKWLAKLDEDIHSEMDRISRALTQRVRALAERYESPMPELAGRVANLESKVNDHLKEMGFAW